MNIRSVYMIHPYIHTHSHTHTHTPLSLLNSKIYTKKKEMIYLGGDDQWSCLFQKFLFFLYLLLSSFSFSFPFPFPFPHISLYIYMYIYYFSFSKMISKFLQSYPSFPSPFPVRVPSLSGHSKESSTATQGIPEPIFEGGNHHILSFPFLSFPPQHHLVNRLYIQVYHLILNSFRLIRSPILLTVSQAFS